MGYICPMLASQYPKYFQFFFHFKCILLQISHKKCFFINIFIQGRFKMAASQYIFVVVIFYIYFLSSTNAKLQFMKQHQCDRCAKDVCSIVLALYCIFLFTE